MFVESLCREADGQPQAGGGAEGAAGRDGHKLPGADEAKVNILVLTE